MIKAVLFDFDGVLTVDKTGSESILKHLSSKTGIPMETFKKSYYKYNKGLLLGEYTHKEIWHDLCLDIGTDIKYSLLLDAFENTLLDNDMIAFAKTLKRQYKIGMITDNKRDRIDAVSRAHNFDAIFDVISVSADFHSGKDDMAIFEQTIMSLCVLPNECVFIDNSAKNLIVPEQLGIKTILFDDENRNINEFQSFFYKHILQLRKLPPAGD